MTHSHCQVFLKDGGSLKIITSWPWLHNFLIVGIRLYFLAHIFQFEWNSFIFRTFVNFFIQQNNSLCVQVNESSESITTCTQRASLQCKVLSVCTRVPKCSSSFQRHGNIMQILTHAEDRVTKQRGQREDVPVAACDDTDDKHQH